MSIRVALHHKTEYLYDRPVTLSPQIVRLRPAPHCRTSIVSYSLKIQPEKQFLNWQQDPYSNYLARLVFTEETRKFTVEVDMVADMVAINPFDFFIDQDAQEIPFVYEPKLAKELHPFLEMQESGPLLTEYAESVRRHGLRSIDFLVELNQKLQSDIRYIIRLEPGIQSCEETLSRRSGSCRDSAQLLVQVLRRLGMAARFVSGYLIQLTADQPSLDGPSGPEKDFTDLHAWAEVYLPGAGWVGLDPTSGLLAGEGHIPLACSAEPVNAAPITGAFSFAKTGDYDELSTDFQVSMKVTRIAETPRVTKPYTDHQWNEIETLGHSIDEHLELGDVRLTMGGEPTFVGIDDRDADEWNTTALGPHKKWCASTLVRRLRDRFAPGGLLHFGQGKWYPGESLPRWAYACYWRNDGIPIWNDPTLVAANAHNYGYTADDAKKFIETVVSRLEVNLQHVLPGYEDTWYYLWKERCLPANVDPLDNKLENKEDRERLAKVFDQGLKKVIGYTIPLRYEEGPGDGKWSSGRWFLRREHLFLIPGDSPMGFRLPLDSLPFEPKDHRHTIYEVDPWAPRGALPSKAHLNLMYSPPSRNGQAVKTGEFFDGIIRTALCVEPRDGQLHVFLPPLERIEHYLELVAAVEMTAKTLHMPVLIEGYPPPFDPRILNLKVTPDPGVIEVNIQPARNWSELVHNTTALYEEARQSRLGAEKFMLDGRHVGTGGGNHIVLGGPTPADSPILRRPDLLRSLVVYWQNHPSLSFLFSGMFVGPTSQAPRVDEARNDSLYELDLAFQRIPNHGPTSPWLVDRLLRNLLIDVTGNTHRTEWCIDKLFSPDSATGRLGLVEFRSFEMPPHQRMSLVQQLLMRAMVARFWDRPYRQQMVRWGTELHDRFMLPHFVAQDFRDVLEEMRQEGFGLRDEWFAPHFEFRFPKFGSLAKAGIQLEVRSAIEPWHVLGEEAVAGGTARYVDSSVERVQVKIQGMTEGRHVLTCNGRTVPLFPTGTNGEFIAGVRYRAWQPPHCLHPTIGVHSPLAFDVVDTWMKRSLCGCTYHVSHPGGRAHDRFPVNANEAEGRRISRFFTHGHTPGPMAILPEERHPECPFTLDLRHEPPRPIAPADPPPPVDRMKLRGGLRIPADLTEPMLIP